MLYEAFIWKSAWERKSAVRIQCVNGNVYDALNKNKRNILPNRSIPMSSCYIHKNSHRKSVKKNQNRFEFTRMNVKSLIYCLYLILSILPKQMIILRSLRILRQMVLNHVVFLCCLQWMRTRKILSFLFRSVISVLFLSLTLSPSLFVIRVYLWAMMFSRFWLLPFVYAQLPFVSDVSLGLWRCLFVCVFFSWLVCRVPCSLKYWTLFSLCHCRCRWYFHLYKFRKNVKCVLSDLAKAHLVHECN